MRLDVSHLTREEIMERFGCSRVTAWRARKRGWVCVQRECPAAMTEDDGRFVLDTTAFVADDDIRGNAILRAVELWGDIQKARDRRQYLIRLAVNEIKRRRCMKRWQLVAPQIIDEANPSQATGERG